MYSRSWADKEMGNLGFLAYSMVGSMGNAESRGKGGLQAEVF